MTSSWKACVIFRVLAQEENAKAEAAAAKRGKNAAKKARRKEREAAIKPVDEPPPAAATPSPPAAKDASPPRTSSKTATAAHQPSASAPLTAEGAEQAGDLDSAAEDAHAAEAGAPGPTAARKRDTMQAPGSAEQYATVPSAAQQQESDPDSADAQRVGLVAAAQSSRASSEDHAGDITAGQGQAGPQGDAGTGTDGNAEASHAIGAATWKDRTSDAVRDEPVLGHLLGDLGISESDQVEPQPVGAPNDGVASVTAPGRGDDSRPAAAQQADAHLLCALTQVRLLCAFAMVVFLNYGVYKPLYWTSSCLMRCRGGKVSMLCSPIYLSFDCPLSMCRCACAIP